VANADVVADVVADVAASSTGPGPGPTISHKAHESNIAGILVVLGSKCREWQIHASECMDLDQLLHLEPPHLDYNRWAAVWTIELKMEAVEGDTVGVAKEPAPRGTCANIHPAIPKVRRV
jgi:hypothetical protein